jgi:hypothetical protein
MNSFEQIKSLLELKEKGVISDADFKKMLDILEAESKKEEKSSGREEAEEELSQQETEQKLRAQANQTTREIFELIQFGKIKEALSKFSSFERKDLFDPKINQLLNEKKAELELKNKTKNEANQNTGLNADEARVEREKVREIRALEKRKKQLTNKIGFALVLLILILAFAVYCSNKKSSANANESQNAKDTAYLENPDTLAKVEHEDALKQKFLAHQYINSKDASLNKSFGIVFLQYTVQNEYKMSSTALGLQQPDALINDPKLIQLLNQQFGLNVKTQQQPNPEPKLKPEPKPKPELQPEETKPQPKPLQQQQPRQEQNSNAELPEFPEKYVTEAEYLKQKIKDPAVSLVEKNLAADRIIAIRKEYESNVNKKWKENPQFQRRLTDCVKVALKY